MKYVNIIGYIALLVLFSVFLVVIIYFPSSSTKIDVHINRFVPIEPPYFKYREKNSLPEDYGKISLSSTTHKFNGPLNGHFWGYFNNRYLSGYLNAKIHPPQLRVHKNQEIRSHKQLYRKSNMPQQHTYDGIPFENNPISRRILRRNQKRYELQNPSDQKAINLITNRNKWQYFPEHKIKQPLNKDIFIYLSDIKPSNSAPSSQPAVEEYTFVSYSDSKKENTSLNSEDEMDSKYQG